MNCHIRRIRNICAIFMICAMASGCAINIIPKVETSTFKGTDELSTELIPKKVALVLSKEFVNYIYYFRRGLDPYQYHLGPTLEAYAKGIVESHFQSVQVVSEPFESTDADFILIPTVRRMELTSFLWATEKQHMTIDVEWTIIAKPGSPPLWINTFSGNSSGQQGTPFSWFQGAKEMVQKMFSDLAKQTNQSFFKLRQLKEISKTLGPPPDNKEGIAKKEMPKTFLKSIEPQQPEASTGPSPEERKIIEKKEMAKTFTNSIGMEFGLISAGKFIMGTPDNEPGRRKNEGPQHEVTITKPFYMGKYEVKVSEFREFVRATGYKTEAEKTGGAFIREKDYRGKREGIYWDNPGFSQNDNHPVTCVSWNDVMEFCKWLTIKTGHFYRLPTEAEWEYACRAGNQKAFSFGSDAKALGTYAWYRDNAGGMTHPGGQKEPNAWGLYDMHGNVREICQDRYRDYSSESVVDPVGPDSGQQRMWRGGTWGATPADCRCGERTSGPHANAHFRLGFRLVMINL